MSRHLMAKMRQAAGEPPRGYGPPPKVDWRHGWTLPGRAAEIEHFNADLADVLSLEPTFIELMRMGVTHKQLREAGMTAATEKMFKLDSEEWAMLGRPKRK
jgi:hypothetical protein